MTLRAVVLKQRQVIVESIENILDKCQNIDATVNNVNLLAPDPTINTDYIPTVKCCDELDKVNQPNCNAFIYNFENRYPIWRI